MRYKLLASSFEHTLFICVLCLLINMNNVIFHGIKLCPFDSSKSTHTLLCDKSINVKDILSSLHLFTPLIILLCFICSEMTLHAINYLNIWSIIIYLYLKYVIIAATVVPKKVRL